MNLIVAALYNILDLLKKYAVAKFLINFNGILAHLDY